MERNRFENCSCGVCKIRGVFATAKQLEPILSDINSPLVKDLFHKLNDSITMPSAMVFIEKQRRVLNAVCELKEALDDYRGIGMPLKVSNVVQFLPGGNQL